MTGDHIRTTHTGSLPRPEDVRAILRRHELGEPIDEQAFASRLPSAVREIVQHELEVGLDVVNDGEVGKVSYATYVLDRCTGFGIGPGERPWRSAEITEFPGYFKRMRESASREAHPDWICNGPVALRDGEAVHGDIARMKAALAAEGREVGTGFMTAATPGIVGIYFRNEHYATDEEYLAAIGEAMRPEYRAIVESGLMLQLDAPDLAATWPDLELPELRRKVAQRVEVINHALEGLPPERVRLHVCWGNSESPHNHDVELKDIIDVLLTVRAGWLVLEGANPRHEHEWEVFRSVDLPEGRGIVAGVIDSTTNFIEHPRVVAQRILRYVDVLGAEKVMAGVDCGFATINGVGLVDPEVAWAKLATLVEGARIATGELAAARA